MDVASIRPASSISFDIVMLFAQSSPNEQKFDSSSEVFMVAAEFVRTFGYPMNSAHINLAGATAQQRSVLRPDRRRQPSGSMTCQSKSGSILSAHPPAVTESESATDDTPVACTFVTVATAEGNFWLQQ